MNNRQTVSSVSHVVIHDKAKKFVIQPLSKEPLTESVQNMMGASLSYEGIHAVFPGDQVRQLWGPKQDQQFWITVIGPNWRYDFEIKKKHFNKLQ